MKPERVPDRLTEIEGLNEVAFIEPRRCFDYVTNENSWVVGLTNYMERYNTFLYLVEIDSTKDRFFRDPQLLTDWT